MANHGGRHPSVEEARERLAALAQQIAAFENGRPAAPKPVEILLERAAYLGVAASQTTPVLQKHLKLPEGVGLVVDYVEPESPAAAAGLEVYDVMLRFDGQLLVNPQQLAVLVRTFDPGAEVKLRIIRAGEPAVLDLKLVERDVKPVWQIKFWDPDAGVDAAPVLPAPEIDTALHAPAPRRCRSRPGARSAYPSAT